MRVSTKGQYAIEIVVDLALHSEKNQIESLKNIAARRNLSVKYLERIIKLLKDKSIVKSMRGVHGGYRLEKPPGELTILEVVIAVEGQLAPVKCLINQGDCKSNCSVCPTRKTWDRMWHIINAEVERLTVADILKAMENKSDFSAGGGI